MNHIKAVPVDEPSCACLLRVERRDKCEMLCAVLKTVLSLIDCYSEYSSVPLFPLSRSVYLQRSISWQLYSLGCEVKWNRLIGKVWHVENKELWKVTRSWHRMKSAVNIYIPSATSVRTATHSKTQLDHSQFTGNKIKCLNSVALVRERTIPTERPPPVGEVSANFCG